VKYILQKLLLFVLTLWAAVTLNFVLPRLMPGSPSDAALAKLSQNGPVTRSSPSTSGRATRSTRSPSVTWSARPCRTRSSWSAS
jgi:ABC-type microcin C transport system permease subunit YejB